MQFFFSDADLERLYEQWEEDDEPLPVDELPEWDPRKPQPQVLLCNLTSVISVNLKVDFCLLN